MRERRGTQRLRDGGEGRRGQGRQWAPRSRPHLKEGPPVRRIEGVQGLLQPPLSGAGRHPRVQAQTQDGALLKTPDVLAEAPKERGCGPRGDSVQPSPPRSPCLNPGCSYLELRTPRGKPGAEGPATAQGPAPCCPVLGGGPGVCICPPGWPGGL